MIPAHNAALTALQAFGTRIQANANNLANSNTEGFKKVKVTLSERKSGGVKASVERRDTPGPQVLELGQNGYEEVELSNVDLAEELVGMNLNSKLYQANLKTIQTADEMLGSLLKLKA